ncbi:MAG: glutamine-hydrolyzing carbamoyl-phosphate synthase small subunit [Phycisphaerales bacterium]
MTTTTRVRKPVAIELDTKDGDPTEIGGWMRPGVLVLEDGVRLEGRSFGWPHATAGEVVFSTGMVGYPESLTDPSFRGQILTCTYPLIGNYGVPPTRVNERSGLDATLESIRIHASALIVQDYSEHHSHWAADRSLARWLHEERIPALTGVDTRFLTRRLRDRGSMLGKIEFEGDEADFYDPNIENLAKQVSIAAPQVLGKGAKRVALLDCGCKHNIIHSLVGRDLEVLRLPWNANLADHDFDGLFISNGPGNPRFYQETIKQIRTAIGDDRPTFGICLGHQLLALAIGANTYKLKYGHRSQNQPVMDLRTRRCSITSQNHGFAVEPRTLRDGWSPWFVNLNDDTNEGLWHESGRFRSVQFHPEAAPGPVDTGYLFDQFVEMLD